MHHSKKKFGAMQEIFTALHQKSKKPSFLGVKTMIQDRFNCCKYVEIDNDHPKELIKKPPPGGFLG